MRCWEGMPEVVEVEIRQSCGLIGQVEVMPHIVPPMPGGIMKDPRHILASPWLVEETPEGVC